MQRITRLALALATVVALASPALVHAQAMSSAEPFKVGTFEIGGASTVGLVLRDALIIDIGAANTALEIDPMYAHVNAPADMLELIGQYEYGLKYRLYEIVNNVVGNDLLGADYVHRVDDVGILPPVMYPSKIMNAAVNFYTHACEGCSEADLAARTQQRKENRGVPYLFLKPTRGAVIGSGEDIVLPYGRDRIEWEVEMAPVFGRSGKYISAARAYDYVFGYMVTIDISDRGGRPEPRSDWFVGKGHNSFAPQGPWIVPKEFYGNPMENLRQTLSVDGETMQEARAGDMIHTLWELVEYASSIVTLFPGDVINNGTSGGTGVGTAVRGAQRFLQPGEVVEASIDGIGTMRINVEGEAVPAGGTGARLPPVDSYRGYRFRVSDL